MTARPLVVFDFDHTLTRADSFETFCRWLLRRQRWRQVLAVIALGLLSPLFLFRGTRKFPIRAVIWVATLGVDNARLDALIAEFVAGLQAAPESLLLREGLAVVERHQAAGDQVVIATGALESLVQAICDAHGVRDVIVVGSTLRRAYGGMVADNHCIGENKVRTLLARGFGPTWACTYTDHEVDLPLLRAAEQRFLINPRPQALDKVSRGLPVAPVVLNWR